MLKLWGFIGSRTIFDAKYVRLYLFSRVCPNKSVAQLDELSIRVDVEKKI